MKKRSLFAAVAMLIVSAIVLTSSTYAWFAASHDATVNQVAASIKASDLGNIQVKVSGGQWKTSLSAEELYAAGNGAKAFANAVDYNPTVSLSAVKVADFDGSNYTVSNGSLGDVLIYSFDVRALNAEAGKSISVPVTFAPGNVPAIFGAIRVDSDALATKIYGSGGYTQVGTVTAATDKNTTGNTNGVIDADEPTDSNTLGTTVTANGGISDTLTLDASTEHTITVYVWAEGQNVNCVDTIDISGCGFTFENITLA